MKRVILDKVLSSIDKNVLHLVLIVDGEKVVIDVPISVFSLHLWHVFFDSIGKDIIVSKQDCSNGKCGQTSWKPKRIEQLENELFNGMIDDDNQERT